ncbi:MAG TPA: phosphatidylglycerophosphatase A [Rhizomicrobium sp.]|nr:phosphatidylglycerophosphatase A [Rhizomicrobium sp.]
MKLRASTIVASVFGIGFFDVAPGTIMSAVATPLALLIAVRAGAMSIVGASLIAFTIGVYACADHMRQTGRQDPPECVIDELAGQWLACAFAALSFGGLLPAGPISIPAFALAFLLFRLFDIWKPWPVSAAENLEGGVGVMLDDMVAGLMAGVLVALARFFFHL